MVDSEVKSPKAKPPKGGRKGGALFPKINLEQALEYAKKLVAKTHTGAQPEKNILPGVFGNAGPIGRIRVSALKQYNLLEGSATGYQATQLAKEIDAALEQELPPLLQQAILNPKSFKQIFDIFHGDTVSKSKIEQRAKSFDVHPESAEEFAQIFIQSAVTAKLGNLNGESLTLLASSELTSTSTAMSGGKHPSYPEDGQKPVEKSASTNSPEDGRTSAGGNQSESEKPLSSRLEKPAVTLSLTVDATSDPDKLEKQLKLLRQYGVI